MRSILCAAMTLTITGAGAADGIDGACANARLPTCKALASDKPQIANAALLGMLDTLAFTSSYWDDRPWLCSDFPKASRPSKRPESLCVTRKITPNACMNRSYG
jgi:hypothetical protein